MANQAGGKMKMKRQGEQNKPYGRRASLFGKVTDTVKDMLSPSWLVDLVHSVKKKTPPPGIDNEHQQQQPTRNHYMQNDGSSFIQPEMSRAGMGGVSADIGRFHIGGNGNDMGNSHSNDNVNSFTSAQLPLNNFKPAFSSGFQHVNEHSDYSASTGGSLAPNMEQRQGQLQSNSHYNRDVNTSHMQQGQNQRMSDNSFLWSKSQPAQAPQTNRSHQPSFNISAFGSNPTSPDSSLFGSSYHKSPYYPGKTTFGGAAAHRKSRQHSPSPYQLTPQRKTVTARPVNKSEGSSVTSSTAKRILDTLERMSTPLSDAKKIPSYSNDSDSSLTLTPATYRRSSLSRSSSLRDQNKNGPPISRRSTPSLASIATNRQPITAKKTEEINDLSPKENVAEKTNNNDEYFKQVPQGGGGRKMKQERGGKHYSNKPVEEDEMVEAPVLPTEFTLPVVAPSFNFGFTPAAPASSANKLKSATPDKSAATSNSLSSASSAGKSPVSGASNGGPFTFASPISQAGPEQANGLSASSPKTFQFSSPVTVDKSKNDNNTLKFLSDTPVFNTAPKPKQFTPDDEVRRSMFSSGGPKPSSEIKTGSVMDILGKPSSDGLAKPASELKSGSVMDILSKKTNGSTSSITPAASELKSGSVMDVLSKGSSSQSPGLGLLFKKPAGSWECDVCMVENKPDVDKCVACTTPKPKPKPKAAAAPAVSAPATMLFKKPAGSWDCDTCMVQNKAEAEKCVACTTPKPKAKTAAPAVSAPAAAKSSGGDLGSLFKKPSGAWECDVCMVQNKADAVKCVACTTPNPKAKSTAPVVTAPAIKVTGQGFNLPKKAQGSWDCDTCFVSNKGESLKCVACQTPKPGVKPTTGFTSTGGFKFGTSSSTDSAKPAGDGLKFGGSTTSSTAAPSSGGFKFGSSTTAESKTETPASTFKFGAPSTDKDSSSSSAAPGGGFKFGAAPAAVSSEKSAESTSKPSGGFKFNVASPTPSSDSSLTNSKSDTTTAPSAGGFKFGVQETGNTDKSSPAPGGFAFGQKADSDSAKSAGLGTLKTDSAAAPLGGGFKFGAPEKPAGDKPAAGTGISFSAPTAAKTESKTEFKPAFGSTPDVTFGAKKTEAPPTTAAATTSVTTSLFQFKPTTTAAKTSSIGGTTPAISFSAGPLGGAKSSASGGSTGTDIQYTIFNKKPDASDTKASPLKRGRDDGDGASDAKKPSFAFSGSTPPASDPFKFGASATTITTTANSGLFTFSANKSTASAAPSPFGAPSTTSAPASIFGAPTSTMASAPSPFAAPKVTAAPAGVFGAPATTTSASTFGSSVFGGFGSNTNSSQPSGFGSSTNQAVPFGGSSTFGSATATTSAPAPVFGAPSSNTSSVFGAPSATTNNASAGGFGGFSSSSTPNFAFGGSNTSKPGGVISFSANSQQQPQSNNSGYNFGGSAAPQAAPAANTGFNFSGSTAPAPSFNFSAGPAQNNPAPPAGNNMFQFNAGGGAATGAPANPFSQAAPQAGRRTIKRAVRKVRR